MVKTVQTTRRKFDFIVCAHKAINQQSFPEQIESGVDESRTTIVLIQNGVGIEQPFREAFPSTTIISCAVCSTCIRIPFPRRRFADIDILRRGLDADRRSPGSSHTHSLRICESGCSPTMAGTQVSTRLGCSNSHPSFKPARPDSRSSPTSRCSAGRRSYSTQLGTP